MDVWFIYANEVFLKDMSKWILQDLLMKNITPQIITGYDFVISNAKMLWFHRSLILHCG